MLELNENFKLFPRCLSSHFIFTSATVNANHLGPPLLQVFTLSGLETKP